ncbi:ABC transporter substrate-binding protein [Cellulomonas sp. NPDC055163]
MTTRRTRLITGLTVGVLALGLGACSSGGDDEGDEGTTADSAALDGKRVGAMDDFGVGDTFVATEPIELSLMYRDHPNYPIQEDWLFFTTLAEKNKVSFETVVAPLSDWEQRRSLLIGAGDAPSIIPVTYPGQEAPFVASGAILPVSDYVDLMPNFQAKVEEWELEPYLDQLRQEDGKYYLLPGLLEAPRPDYTIGIRTDVFEAAGAETEPETWEDLAESFAKVKAANPSQYPFSDRWSNPTSLGAFLNVAAPSFGTIGGWGYVSGVQWDSGAEEFVYAGATDEYRDLVEYVHGLVEDGLMDPESLTQEDAAAEQKLVSGQSSAMSTNRQEMLRHRATFAEQGSTGAQFEKIRVPSGPAGDLTAGTRLESGIMLSSSVADEETFVATLQLIDWLYYSDEGLEFAKWGVEGETYEKADDGTRTLASDITYLGLNPGAPKQLNVDYGFNNGVFLLAQGSTTDLVYSMLDEEELAWQEEMATKEAVPVAPPYPLDEIEREQVSLYQTALTDYVEASTLQFILGDRPLSEWDAYVAELEGMNLTAFMDAVNGAHQRYEEANG